MAENKELKPTKIAITREIYEGALPPPEMLRSYEKIRAGTAQEIIEMAQEAQRHYIFMDKQEVKREFLNLIFSFILGFIGQIGSIAITLSGFYMAYFYIQAGEPKLGYGTAISATAICGYLIWWKVKETSQDRKERTAAEDKDKQNKE